LLQEHRISFSFGALLMKSPQFRRRSRLILRILQRAALAAAILLLAAGAYYRRKSYEPGRG
jgi:hypothetical protein